MIDGKPISRSDFRVSAVETPAVRGTGPKVGNQRRIRLVLFSDPDPDEAVPFVHDEGFGANVPLYRIGLDRHILGHPVLHTLESVIAATDPLRSEERRVGKECDCKCITWVCPDNL